MVEPQHGLAAFGMVAQAKDNGMKFAKENWQVLTVCGTLLMGGGSLATRVERVQADVATLSERLDVKIGRLEDLARTIDAKASTASERAANVETALREIRKDQRAGGKVGTIR